MKHIFICALAVAAIASCKPQKPWSPNDPESGIPNEKHKNTQATSFGVNEQFDADIGDVEAQVFINGKVAANAEAPNVSVEEDFDSRKHLLRSNVT
ncbi:MAG: hypothetical protein SGI88_18820, partial [Candidatus Hydrogenedentes bacterium]|nr:hypothetical protein [Candidatus Hydrogenedentota bacterium]